MKTKSIVTFTSLAIGLMLATSALAASDAELRKSCDQKRNANACLEVGMSDLRKNTPASRKQARQSLKRGCALQKGKVQCSKEEAKTVAKAFLASQGRVPASKSTIKAPKISNPGTRVSNVPAAPEPPHIEAPPAPPMQNYEPAPPPQMMMPAPSNSMSAGPCMPGDPSCSQ